MRDVELTTPNRPGCFYFRLTFVSSSFIRIKSGPERKGLQRFRFCWMTPNELILIDIEFGCADSDGEIPDPIPNSEVKPVSGDGTAL